MLGTCVSVHAGDPTCRFDLVGSAGEYVAAEKIEAAYKKNNLVDQIWVYGNSLESTLVAIVVPAGRHRAHCDSAV